MWDRAGFGKTTLDDKMSKNPGKMGITGFPEIALDVRLADTPSART
jgi:hypothetical protein